MFDRRRCRARDLASGVRSLPTPPHRTSTASTLGPTPRRPRLLCRLEAPGGDGGGGSSLCEHTPSHPLQVRVPAPSSPPVALPFGSTGR